MIIILLLKYFVQLKLYQSFQRHLNTFYYLANRTVLICPAVESRVA